MKWSFLFKITKLPITLFKNRFCIQTTFNKKVDSVVKKQYDHFLYNL